MLFLNQFFLSIYQKSAKGFKGYVDVVALIIIGAILLTAAVSAICFGLCRQINRRSDINAPNNDCNKTPKRRVVIKILGLAIGISIVGASVGVCIWGTRTKPVDNYISPALAAKLKVISCFDTNQVVKIYQMETEEIFQIDFSELRDELAKEEDIFVSLGREGESIFSVNGLERIEWGYPRSYRSVSRMYFDIANVEAIRIDDKLVQIQNVYGFVCNEFPKYTLALYETDQGLIWGVYSPLGRDLYFEHAEFVKYATRDKELILEKYYEHRATGKALLGGYGYFYEDPTVYNPLNVTLVTKEGGWTNSHTATLYIIACAIVHAALVCGIWFAGYQIYKRKHKAIEEEETGSVETLKTGEE